MSRAEGSWPGRLIAYLRHNYRGIAVDIALLMAWVILGTEVLRFLGAPRWFQYLVLFGGVIGYVRLTSNWERPPPPSG